MLAKRTSDDLDLSKSDLSESKRLARRAVELIKDDMVGCALITARKRA